MTNHSSQAATKQTTEDQSTGKIETLESEEFSEGLRRSPEFEQRWRETKERRDLSWSLVQMRRSAGLTQNQLAKAMGKDQAFVSRMESATGPMPKAQHIALYAKNCGYMTAYAFLEAPKSDVINLHQLRAVGQNSSEMTLLNNIRDISVKVSRVADK